MNAIEFSNALGKVNDKYIMEAVTYERKKKSGWLKWGIMAACLGLILAVGVMTLPNILQRKNDIVPPPKPNPNLQVVYQPFSIDWPVYESADELIEACDKVIVGTVTNISFQVLDIRTGKTPEEGTDDFYRKLYTIYDIDVVETYKGDSKSTEQVRIIGGLEGAYVTEQLTALGHEQATIFVLDGLMEISMGGTYLFMLDQYEDVPPTIVNIEQGIYDICDAFTNEPKKDGNITVQEIISSFGTDAWRKFESIAQESSEATRSQNIPDKSNEPIEYPNTVIVPGFDLDEPSEPTTP